MQRSPSEFVQFVGRHYHLLAEMCLERTGFRSDDEIAAFIRSRVNAETNPARLITEMKRLGVLTQITEDWAPPPFLERFIRQLNERHVLATPAVVRAWVVTLQGLAGDLDRMLDSFAAGAHDVDEEAMMSLLRDIGDAIHVVGTTISDNIERIGEEVAEYRATEDAPRMRSRLRRLVDLYDNYLTPIMRVLDTSGSFRAVTQQISTQCARLARADGPAPAPLAHEGNRLRRQVVWLRRTVLHQADEANAELAPLCVAAARESAVARGVNRALETIRQQQWEVLDLTDALPVVLDQDSGLAGDDAIAAFMQDAFSLRDEPPPRLIPDEPDEMLVPPTASALQDLLNAEEQLDDLLEWVIEQSEARPDTCVNLLHRLLDLESARVTVGDECREYSFEALVIEAGAWTWSRRNE